MSATTSTAFKVATFDGAVTTYPQVDAIEKCQYPSILGHFFAAHSVHPDKYTWFGAGREHLPMMMEYSARIIDACKKKGTVIDLTGVHMKTDTVAEKMDKNSFMVDFQRYVVNECKNKGVYALYGSDAHSLASIGNAYDYYKELFGEDIYLLKVYTPWG